MSQLNKWMVHGKISKLVVVITDKDSGDHVERWQFDVQLFSKASKKGSSSKSKDKENAAPESISFSRTPGITSKQVIGKAKRRKTRPRRSSKMRSRPSFVRSPPR